MPGPKAPPVKEATPHDPIIAPSSFSIVVVQTEEELAPYLEAWNDLARNALEANIYYESWMLLPALRAFGTGSKLEFVLVLGTVPGRDTPVLCGFFPLERRWGYKGLPVSYLSLWRHRHCFLCLPLLRASCAGECLSRFLDWLANDPRGAALMEWPWMSGEGPVHQLLIDQNLGRSRLCYLSEQYTRGLFRPRADAEAYLKAALAPRYHKELRRKEKRLHEQGQVEYRTLGPGEDVQGWIDAFLRLEASGWKGAHGTALAARPLDQDYFRMIAAEAFRRGQLLMLGLFLNDEPIALKCNFLAGAGSFAFKIAFDEEQGCLSPGYQLEIANIRELHQRPRIQWMDSCTGLEPSMFDRLWIDRRVIQTMLMSTGRTIGDLVVSMLPLLRWLKRRSLPKPRQAG